MYKYYLIWYSKNTLRNYRIGELTYLDNLYIFKYTNPDLIDAVNDGFKYYPGFNDINKTYTSSNLFTNIDYRLPNTNKDGYLDLLNKYNLNINSTRLEILHKTYGKLITDTYYFVPAYSSLNVFYLANRRHFNDALSCRKEIDVCDKLELYVQDNDTIMVYFKNKIIGFIPEYYIKDIKEMIDSNKRYSLLVDKLNINSSVDSDDKIRVRLLCEA